MERKESIEVGGSVRMVPEKLLVYTPVISNRLSYILDIILPGSRLTSDKAYFLAATGARINYSTEQLASGIFQIVPHPLLAESGIQVQETGTFQWEGFTVFFGTKGDIPFDIFAASFYLLTRYEEYLTYSPDMYGRYAHTNSLACRENFLQLPLVNLWKKTFCLHLQKYFPGFLFPETPFRFLPTYDIDIAYAYQHQPLWKKLAIFYRALLQGNFDKVVEMGNVFTGKQKDPFDSFVWLDDLHGKLGLTPMYFFLTLVKKNKYDKNLPAASKKLQKLYKGIADRYACGLHPSWQSGSAEWLLVKEKHLLENIIDKKVYHSRNHYLRMVLPNTYRRLIAAGITDDHSMAYGTINGFRASYSSPYPWYDLEKESATNLILHPFCFMEATAFFQQGYTAERAGIEMQYYYDTVKQVNGEFISLFHNHFLSTEPQWLPWRKMYAGFLERNAT